LTNKAESFKIPKISVKERELKNMPRAYVNGVNSHYEVIGIGSSVVTQAAHTPQEEAPETFNELLYWVLG